jgi:hypothetical protein
MKHNDVYCSTDAALPDALSQRGREKNDQVELMQHTLASWMLTNKDALQILVGEAD